MTPQLSIGLSDARFAAAAASFERRSAQQATTVAGLLAALPPVSTPPVTWGAATGPSWTPPPALGTPVRDAVTTYRSAFDELLGSFSASAPAAATWGGLSSPSIAIGGGRGDSPASLPPGTSLNPFKSFSNLPPDPMFIVRTSAWPAGMGAHWGLQHKLGWLQALMEPHLDLSRSRERLAEAQGLLYQQHAEGAPNRSF